MNPRAYFLVLACLILSCSVLKKEDPDKQVREFMSAFQVTLQKSDEEIMKLFEARQNEYVIFQILKILQNKENSLITSQANFSAALVTVAENDIKVEVPVTLLFQEKRADDGGQAIVTFWLKAKENSFVITKVGGELLYQEYTSLKNRNEWLIAENAALEERKPLYSKAMAFQSTYDTVIWYTNYRDADYFYVAQGEWNSTTSSKTKMGLIDSTGEIVVPIEYELIGTLGFDRDNIVEITKDGKVGFFNIYERKVIAEPIYDVIIPYGNDNIMAVVRKDSLYGSLDSNWQYSEGFPSDRVENWVRSFEYLRKPISLKAGNQSLCEIPREDYAGNGFVMPPSYFVANGLFDKIESGISTTSIPMNAWTEYKETQGTVFEKLTSNLNAVITTIKERYIEGREEFYTKNKLVFVNNSLDTLSVSEVEGESITISSVDSSLLEVRTPEPYWFGENEVSDESNLISYNYFRINSNGVVEKLKSQRLFPQTQFVKLDSAYITGNFVTYNYETEKSEQRPILSIRTLTSMRNEILASYGYRFPSEEDLERYKPYSWYEPKYDNISDFENEMTDIDKHNLRFLDDVIVRLKSQLAFNS